MENHEKIEKYLKNLQSTSYAMGGEGKAFFVGDDRVLKILCGAEEYGNGCSNKYIDPKYFYADMEKMTQLSNKLNKSGIKVPRIEDYAIMFVDDTGREQQIILQERMIGNPVGIEDEKNLQGEENRGLIAELQKYTALKDEKRANQVMAVLTKNLNKYNIEMQESVLDAPEKVLTKFVKNIEKIHTKYGQVRLDPYCENIIYNNDAKEFAIIDFNVSDGTRKPDLSTMLGDILPYFSFENRSERIDPQVWKNSDSLVCKLLVVAFDNGLWKYPVSNKVELCKLILCSIQDERVKNAVFNQLFYRR